MALYHEAASLIHHISESGDCNLERLCFDGSRKWQSNAKQRFALVSETLKWRLLLKEVVENSEILKLERKLSAALVLVLIHDHLLRKQGIALASSHPLVKAILTHKTRLAAEITRCRLKRQCTTLEDLRATVEAAYVEEARVQTESAHANCQSTSNPSSLLPRWIRLNALKGSDWRLDIPELSAFVSVPSLDSLQASSTVGHGIFQDLAIPNLFAISSKHPVHRWQSYKQGRLILQDKGSCFPAQLLCHGLTSGDIIDACAAPGNKTTQMAALMHGERTRSRWQGQIKAFERDAARCNVLRHMLERAGAACYLTVQNRDFLEVDPADFPYVEAILLDPSCSGSGMLDRQTGIERKIEQGFLPSRETSERRPSKRRKIRTTSAGDKEEDESDTTVEQPVVARGPDQDSEAYALRLHKLSNLQSQLLRHAFKFPAARKIVYSTCSVHVQENESVVRQALESQIALKRGWRVIKRDEQPVGLRSWDHRGEGAPLVGWDVGQVRVGETLQACIRCPRGGDEGTGGFFVCGFIREYEAPSTSKRAPKPAVEEDGEKDDWSGFSD